MLELHNYNEESCLAHALGPQGLLILPASYLWVLCLIYRLTRYTVDHFLGRRHFERHEAMGTDHTINSRDYLLHCCYSRHLEGLEEAGNQACWLPRFGRQTA